MQGVADDGKMNPVVYDLQKDSVFHCKELMTCNIISVGSVMLKDKPAFRMRVFFSFVALNACILCTLVYSSFDNA